MTTVLVVDDSATDRRLAGGLLEKEFDWNVIYAADGADALEQLELHLPDLVVTDLQMPRMNGLELVRAVKKDYPLIPVILMTAQGSEEIAVEALQQGAANYVPKRRLVQDLVDTVARVKSISSDERNLSRLLNRMTENTCVFVVDNDFSLIGPLVSYLQQVMRAMRLCARPEQLRAGIALEEALVNAFYHGNLEVGSQLREADHKAYYELAKRRCGEAPYRDRRIRIEATFSRSEAVYHIQDDGPGFDPTQLPDPTDPANLDRPCGRGVLLMRTFMDDVRFNDQGNIVTLIKRRTPETEEELESEERA